MNNDKEYNTTFEESLNAEVKEDISERRKQKLYNWIVFCLAVIIFIICLTLSTAIAFSAYLYGIYLLDNNSVEPQSIQTIERVTIFAVGGVAGFFVKLLKDSTSDNK